MKTPFLEEVFLDEFQNSIIGIDANSIFYKEESNFELNEVENKEYIGNNLNYNNELELFDQEWSSESDVDLIKIALFDRKLAWALGKKVVSNNYKVYRYYNNVWKEDIGAGIDIQLDFFGIPWVLNSSGELYRFSLNNWINFSCPYKIHKFGLGKATLWILGGDIENGNYKIYLFDGFKWQLQSGTGVEIAIDMYDMPWVINSRNELYNLRNNTWYLNPVSAFQIYCSRNNVIWILKNETDSKYKNDYKVAYLNPASKSWIQVDGAGVRISADKYGNAFIINSFGKLFRFKPQALLNNVDTSFIAQQAKKQWIKEKGKPTYRPKSWQNNVYGLVVHTTGSGLPNKADRDEIYPTLWAANYYYKSYGTHYVNGWQGFRKGDLVQIASESKQANGVEMSEQLNSNFSDLNDNVKRNWKNKWKGMSNPIDLLPETKHANSCYNHVECIPLHYDKYPNKVKQGEVFIPLRAGIRFTKEQHEVIGLLAYDIAIRNNWPLDSEWWKTPRLLGHEDLSPKTRHDSKGGWDPGGLRDVPFFDWEFVFNVIKDIKTNGIFNYLKSKPIPIPELINDIVLHESQDEDSLSFKNINERVYDKGHEDELQFDSEFEDFEDQELQFEDFNSQVIDNQIFSELEIDSEISKDPPSIEMLSGKTIILNISSSTIHRNYNTGVYIPITFENSRSIKIVLYFHGLLRSFDKIKDISTYWKYYSDLRKAIDQTNGSFILVCPFLGSNPQNTSYLFFKKFGLDKYLQLIIANLAKQGLIIPNSTIKELVLSGHSAGGFLLSKIPLIENKINSNIHKIIGFDCFYDYNWTETISNLQHLSLYNLWAYDTKGKKSITGKRSDSLAKRFKNVFSQPPFNTSIGHQKVIRSSWNILNNIIESKEMNNLNNSANSLNNLSLEYLYEDGNSFESSKINNEIFETDELEQFGNGIPIELRLYSNDAQIHELNENNEELLESSLISSSESYSEFEDEDVNFEDEFFKELLTSSISSNKAFICPDYQSTEWKEVYNSFTNVTWNITPNIGTAEFKKEFITRMHNILRKATLDPDLWFKSFTNTTFLGLKFNHPIHKVLATHLKFVERFLVNKHGGQMKDTLVARKVLGISESIKGGRTYSSTAKKGSMHTFGLAVDIEYLLNPYIGGGNDKRKAINLIISRAFKKLRQANGEDINKYIFEPDSNQGYSLEGRQLIFRKLTLISNLLKEYFLLSETDRSIKEDYRDFRSKVSRANSDLIKNNGILTLPVSLIEDLDMHWGGSYGDIMHFDLRNKPIGKRLYLAITS